MTGWATPRTSSGSRWRRGGSGQGGGPKGQGPGGGRHHAPHPRPGQQAVPAHHHGNGHSGCGPKVRQQALPQGGEACVLGLRGVWLGLAEKALGRIQWATAACPLAKSMLQPLWAWKMATTTVGKPPKVVRMLAFMLRFLFNTPFVQYSPYLPKSSWWGCSNASASDEGLAFVGGWCANKMEPEKKEVYWFHEQIHVEEYLWAFKNGDPKRRIAALQMLGTLFLCNMILTHQGPLSSRVRLPVGSDNQGNVMAMLNLGSKKPYTAAILMELVFLLHAHGCSLAANRVPREFNQWADELTHPDFSEFDPLHRVPKQELCEEFIFLPRLLNGDAFDLSVAYPCSRDRSRWVTHFPWWQTPLWPGCPDPPPRGGRYQSAHPFFSF